MIANCARPAIWAKTPIISRISHDFDANATAGNMTLRSRNGVYAFSCWIAWPTSWAAIATEATAFAGEHAGREVDGALSRVVVVGQRAARTPG